MKPMAQHEVFKNLQFNKRIDCHECRCNFNEFICELYFPFDVSAFIDLPESDLEAIERKTRCKTHQKQPDAKKQQDTIEFCGSCFLAATEGGGCKHCHNCEYCCSCDHGKTASEV